MNLSVHINFNGNCQEAFEYYAQHLNGEIGTLLTFRNSPASANVPEHWQDKIVHANIKIAGIELAGGDNLPEQYNQPKGFCILLGLETEAEVLFIFDKLSPGGDIILSPQKTFWSSCYAIMVDRFGVPWKLNCGD
ncbi:MAG TPA: VOC family protein [Cellvibrionaceae bacterium]